VELLEESPPAIVRGLLKHLKCPDHGRESILRAAGFSVEVKYVWFHVDFVPFSYESFSMPVLLAQPNWYEVLTHPNTALNHVAVGVKPYKFSVAGVPCRLWGGSHTTVQMGEQGARGFTYRVFWRLSPVDLDVLVSHSDEVQAYLDEGASTGGALYSVGGMEEHLKSAEAIKLFEKLKEEGAFDPAEEPEEEGAFDLLGVVQEAHIDPAMMGGDETGMMLYYTDPVTGAKTTVPLLGIGPAKDTFAHLDAMSIEKLSPKSFAEVHGIGNEDEIVEPMVAEIKKEMKVAAEKNVAKELGFMQVEQAMFGKPALFPVHVGGLTIDVVPSTCGGLERVYVLPFPEEGHELLLDFTVFQETPKLPVKVVAPEGKVISRSGHTTDPGGYIFAQDAGDSLRLEAHGDDVWLAVENGSMVLWFIDSIGF